MKKNKKKVSPPPVIEEEEDIEEEEEAEEDAETDIEASGELEDDSDEGASDEEDEDSDEDDEAVSDEDSETEDTDGIEANFEDPDDEDPPQDGDSPGFSKSTEAEDDEGVEQPDTAGATSEGTVIFGGEWGVANELMRTWRDGLNKNTGKLYTTHLHRFFQWCAAQKWTPEDLPDDALVQYCATVIPAHAQFAVSAVKSFIKSGYAGHMGLAPLEYPKIKRPPSRKKRNQETMPNDIPSIEPRGDIGEALDRLDAQAPQPPRQSPPSPRQGARIGGEPMSRPAPAARRDSTAPITDLLPPRGRFRIWKCPNHGPNAGERIMVTNSKGGLWFQADVTGFPDIPAFIAARIAPTNGPGPNDPPLNYEIEILNEFGRAVPPNMIVTIAPPSVEGAGQNNGYARRDENSFSPMEKEWMEDRKRDRQMLEQMLHKQGNSSDSIALILREFDRSTADLVTRFDKKIDELKGEVRRNASAAAAANFSPRDLGPDPNTEMVKTFAGLAERSVDKAMSRADREPSHAADPTAMMANMFGMVKGLLSEIKPTAPTTDPAVAAALASIAEGQKQLTQLIAGMVNKPPLSLDQELEKTAKIIALTREISGAGDGGGGSPSGPEQVAHAISQVLSAPVLVEAARSLSGNQRRTQTKGGGGGGAAVAPKSRQVPPPLPEPAAHALQGMKEATTLEATQEALLTFFQELQDSGSDFWLRVLHRTGEAFKSLESEEEVQPFVMAFLREIRQPNLHKEVPGLVTRVTAVIVENYPALHQLMAGEPKSLMRAPTPKTPQPTVTPEDAKPEVPEVKSKPEPPTVLPESKAQRKAMGVVEPSPVAEASGGEAEQPRTQLPEKVDEPPAEDGDFGEVPDDVPEEEDGSEDEGDAE